MAYYHSKEHPDEIRLWFFGFLGFFKGNKPLPPLNYILLPNGQNQQLPCNLQENETQYI